MKKKQKIIIIAFVIILITFASGITYSLFHSETDMSTDQGIAGFIFNAQRMDELNLPITNLNPGDENEYPFSVSNNSQGNTSDVAIEYQMILKTYHFVPVIIEIYRINDTDETLILECDETYSRNSTNELTCNAPIQEMSYNAEVLDNYKIKVRFLEEYNDAEYADLVDYINIEIRSWQKLNE